MAGALSEIATFNDAKGSVLRDYWRVQGGPREVHAAVLKKRKTSPFTHVQWRIDGRWSPIYSLQDVQALDYLGL